MSTEYVERTPGGQEIHIYDNRFQQTRVHIMLQGVEINMGLDNDYVAMSLQDARELHAALGKALAAHDAAQQEQAPTSEVPDGLPSGYFIVQVPGRDEWLAGAIGYSEFSQYVYGTDYIDAADMFDRPVHYPSAEAARQACWQDVTPGVGGQNV